MDKAEFDRLRELVTHNEVFQACCQRYARANGSSGAIAAAAVRLVLASLEKTT